MKTKKRRGKKQSITNRKCVQWRASIPNESLSLNATFNYITIPQSLIKKNTDLFSVTMSDSNSNNA